VVCRAERFLNLFLTFMNKPHQIEMEPHCISRYFGMNRICCEKHFFILSPFTHLEMKEVELFQTNGIVQLFRKMVLPVSSSSTLTT
jgi:hypothetical protein